MLYLLIFIVILLVLLFLIKIFYKIKYNIQISRMRYYSHDSDDEENMKNYWYLPISIKIFQLFNDDKYPKSNFDPSK